MHRRFNASREAFPGDDSTPRIVVDDQQAEPTGYGEIRDPDGRHPAYAAHGFSDKDIAIANQRLAFEQPRSTTREVLDHVQCLERQ